jgi:hypothetical protein
MRLAGVKNIPEGNAFLEGYLSEYNRGFAKEAAEKADFHQPIVNKRALDAILAIKTDRALRNDLTVSHDKKLYQVKNNIRARKVTVEERTDGSMRILYNGFRLRFKEIQVRTQREKPAKEIAAHKSVQAADNSSMEVSSEGNDQSANAASDSITKPDILALVRIGLFGFGLTVSVGNIDFSSRKG